MIDDNIKLPPEVEAALLKSDALSNALACRLAETPEGNLGAFFDEIVILEGLTAEADLEFERLRREHGIED